MSEKQHLFEYWFEGETYGLTVMASSVEEAGRKVRRMSSAEYKGKIELVVQVSPSSFKRWLQSLVGMQ